MRHGVLLASVLRSWLRPHEKETVMLHSDSVQSDVGAREDSDVLLCSVWLLACTLLLEENDQPPSQRQAQQGRINMRQLATHSSLGQRGCSGGLLPNRRYVRTPLLIALALCVQGCLLGPDFKTPPALVADTWLERGNKA